MFIKIILFSLLYRILGNPLLAVLVLVVVYLLIDRSYFGFVPSPMGWFTRQNRVRELKNIITVNPHDARSLKELGVFMFESGNYKGAADYFARAAGRMSDDHEFNYYYGVCLARLGEVIRGRELVESAVSRSPGLKYGDPYLMMAEVLLDNGAYEDALSLLERFEKIHSSSSRGFYRKGFAQMKLGRKEEGRASLMKSVEVFRTAPRYKRKLDRKWAWKSRILLMKQGSKPAKVKRFIIIWSPPILWAGLIFWMSTEALSAHNTSLIVEPLIRFFFPQAAAQTVDLAHGIIRKCGHVTEYFVLGLLLFRALRLESPESGPRKWAISALILTVLYAASDEFHQSFSSVRTASVMDVGIDALGGVLAQLTGLLSHKRSGDMNKKV